MKNAVCYIRVSTEEQTRGGVSLPDQEARLRHYCASRELEVIEVIREEGVSASKALSTRPGGTAMLKLLAEGKASHVVALKLDRVFRSAIDARIQTDAWDKGGVSLHLVDFGGEAMSTSGAVGRFFLGVMAEFAELERGLCRERTKAALAHKKKNRQAYSPTPYGYDRRGTTLHANPKEQAVITQIRALRGRGASLRAIVRELKDEPTKQGGQWYAGTVKYLLDNTLYQEAV
jgi:DNA invertase Pin-like site-specific DNA recombinase